MKRTKISALFLSLGLISSTVVISTAYGSAFQLFDQDASQLGNDYAGSVASANTPGTEYYNPAGMTNIKHTEMSLGATAINTHIAFLGYTSTDVGGDINQSPTSTAQGGGLSVLPNLHVVVPFAQRWAWGFGITVPFGLQTYYPAYSAAANAATLTSIQTINLGTSLAFKVNNWASIAVGLDEQEANGVFDQAPNLTGYDPVGLHNELSGWAMGWHAAALFNLTQNSHLGFNYRSAINHNVGGTSESIAQSYYYASNTGVNSQIKLPDTFSLGYYLDLTPQWSVMAKADYTRWDSIQNITLNNVEVNAPGGAIQTNIVLPENFKNTWNFAVGADYHLNQHWIWKVGGGVDQSPVNDADRNLRLPDNNRFILSTGINYAANDNLTVDLGYEHLFLKAVNINNNATVITAESLAIAENGQVKSSADILGAQLTWKFV